MITKRNFVSGIALVALALVLVVQGSQYNASAADGRVMDGSWVVDVNIVGAPQPFKALITYTPDGSVIETDAGQLPPPVASASTGHGEWVKIGKREFAFTFVKLLFDRSGSFIGTMKLSSSVKYGSEQYDDAFKFDVADPAGNVIMASTGTGHATRINAVAE